MFKFKVFGFWVLCVEFLKIKNKKNMINKEFKWVVVIGMGVIILIGNILFEYWDGLLNGKSGVDKIILFDSFKYKCCIAVEVKGFDFFEYMDCKQVKYMDCFIQFVVVVSKQIIVDVKFEINDLNVEQVGVIIGIGVGGIKVLEDQ